MRLLPLVLLLCVGALIGCTTTPTEIPADLEPNEYFQRAQEAVVERSDYLTALAYYETYLERFVNDVQLQAEAEYEIAFIYYKLGEYEISRERFERLVARYRSDTAGLLPGWPLVLSEKVLAEIEQLRSATEEE